MRNPNAIRTEVPFGPGPGDRFRATATPLGVFAAASGRARARTNGLERENEPPGLAGRGWTAGRYGPGGLGVGAGVGV